MERLNLSNQDIQSLRDRIRSNNLGPSDQELLLKILSFVSWISGFVSKKGSSITRLRKWMGLSLKKESSENSSSEKQSSEKEAPEPPEDPQPPSSPSGNGNSPKDPEEPSSSTSSKQKGGKLPGSGPNGSKDYTGAQEHICEVEGIQSGELCPQCQKFRVYPDRDRVLIVVHSQPPFGATRYVQKTLRCRGCDSLFKGNLPPRSAFSGKIQEDLDPSTQRVHYGAEVVTDLVTYRYELGVPWYRLQKIQEGYGIPLPDSTQWELCRDFSTTLIGAYARLIEEFLERSLIHLDDTSTRIQELKIENRSLDPKKNRTGMFCNGFFSPDPFPIVLFFQGRPHCGERLGELFELREQSLEGLILMSDASSSNGVSLSSEQKAQLIQVFCLAHWILKIEEQSSNFEADSKWMREQLHQIYQQDASCLEKEWTPLERLKYHQLHSKPIMDELQQQCQTWLKEKKYDPSGQVAPVLRYGLKHWEQFTQFLKVEGAPLDNNVLESIFGLTIGRLRRNSLHFRNLQGAWVGDIFLSLIATCQKQGVNAREYFRAFALQIRLYPEAPALLPWEWKQNLEKETHAA